MSIWAIYPRKSRENDSSVSMEMQIDVCREYILRTNPDAIIRVFDGDYGITGHSTKKRKDFQRMMEDARQGIIQSVVVYKYDRIARNMYDFVNLFHDLEEVGCNLISVTENVDTSTPSGKQMMYQFGSWAEYEWSLNSTRRRDANTYARKIGVCKIAPACFPFGYKAEIIDGQRKMVIDRELEPIVRDVHSYYAMTQSLAMTNRYVNSKYGFNWSRSKLNTTLTSTFYHGEYRENPNYCEPYFTKEEHQKILDIKNKYIRHQSDDKRYMLFTSLIKCPVCGRNADSQVHKYPTTTTYYYRCWAPSRNGSCTFTRYISEIKVEKQLIEYIDTFLAKLSYNAKIQPNRTVKKPKRTINHQAELDRLTKAYIKGRIEEDEYDKEYERLTKLIKEQTESNEVKTKSESEIAKYFSSDWKDSYSKLDREHKKYFWSSIIKEIHINPDTIDISDVDFL